LSSTFGSVPSVDTPKTTKPLISATSRGLG